jgi:hypothetical protein
MASTTPLLRSSRDSTIDITDSETPETYTDSQSTSQTSEIRKRKRVDNDLWLHTRPPQQGEQERDKHKHVLLYCKHCPRYNGSPNYANFRKHLKSHSIYLTPPESSIKLAKKRTIQDVFNRQEELQEGRNIEQEKLLQDAIQGEEFKESIARLVTL